MASKVAPLALLLAPLALGQAYQPGTPGAPWTLQEMNIVKAKLFRFYHLTGLAPRAVRLGFHDCLKYADGTGGCDGCLNWSGMEHKFGIDGGPASTTAHTRGEENIEEGNNNGLADIVRHLEKAYTQANWWGGGAPDLEVSLRDSGKSRADLWAFASIVAVEYGIETTNIACTEGDNSSRIKSGGLCLHNFGESSCMVTLAENFKFQTGRSDCVERDSEFGYKATKAEHHPSPIVNGRSTIEFFRDSFAMTGREVVALMGAHTFGKPHMHISLFPYTWTSKATNLWNNDYYKTITGRPRWFYSPQGSHTCNKVGDAFGNIPETRWLTHTRMCTKRGGPIFWIHENLVCPDCNREDLASSRCCQNVPAGQQCLADRPGPGDQDPSIHNGCERFRFISGADEIALNAEMGLYRDFEVTDGIIHGCPGLEIFNETMRSDKKKTVWSTGEDGRRGEPRCGLQRLEEPAGSGDPLHAIFDEYADDQSTWMRDFVPAMHKMLANGYPAGLTDAPVPRGVVCPFPDGTGNKWKATWSCYRKEAAGSGPALVIRSDCNWAGFETTGRVVQAGATGAESWSFTGEPKQLWTWSESGNQLINQETGLPFTVAGFTEWKVDSSRQSDLLVTQYAGKALDAWAARKKGCGGKLIVGNTHGGGGQWFTLVPVQDMVPDPSLTCAATTAAATPTTTTPRPTTTPATTTATESAGTTTIDLSTSNTCTDDGSVKEPEIFILQNVRDSYVVSLDAAGNPSMARRDQTDPSQLWEFSALCSGEVILTNIGTDRPLNPGPWTYDPHTQTLKGSDGKVMRSTKKHKFKFTKKISYIKENGQTTDQPWDWFKWEAVVAA